MTSKKKKVRLLTIETASTKAFIVCNEEDDTETLVAEALEAFDIPGDIEQKVTTEWIDDYQIGNERIIIKK